MYFRKSDLKRKNFKSSIIANEHSIVKKYHYKIIYIYLILKTTFKPSCALKNKIIIPFHIFVNFFKSVNERLFDTDAY